MRLSCRTLSDVNQKRYFVGTILATALAVAGGAGLALGVSKLASSGQKKEPPKAPALPAPPNAAKAASRAEDAARRKRAAMSQTVFTSPLGIGGQAQVARKTLTGQ